MTETITRFTREMMHISDNVFYMSLSFLFLIFCLVVMYWFYNRKKMHQLQHQIPAEVLKNYLDSVIQNSNALKSSLFRGGGLEVGTGIPSVVPTGSLPTGNVGAAGAEELAQKNAEIASLNGQLSNKNAHIRDLESQLASIPPSTGNESEDLKIMQEEMGKLRSQLSAKQAELEAAQAAAGAGADPAEVDTLKKENQELRDRLKEYEIIEEDLANLRRLQQENEQLKAELASLKGGAPAAASEPEPTPEPEPAPEPEAAIPKGEPQDQAGIDAILAAGAGPAEDEPVEDLEAAMAAAIAGTAEPEKSDDEMMVPSNEGEQKSAEELLSEFEKMLG